MKNLAPVLAVVAMAFAAPALAEPANRMITVTGTAQVDAAPDMATITIGVTHQNKEAQPAMAQVSDAVGRILAGLTDKGIAARDMQTRNLSLSPIRDNPGRDGGKPRITGFAASNSVLVRVRDLSGLGGILDAVIGDGANNFNGLQFSVADPGPLEDQARAEAIADATAKAKLMAEAAGVTLGPVQTITEQGGRGGPVMMEMSAARGGSVPIAAGEVSVSAQVTMVFSIAD